MISNIDPPLPRALDIFSRHGGCDRNQRWLGDLALEVTKSLIELNRPAGEVPLFNPESGDASTPDTPAAPAPDPHGLFNANECLAFVFPSPGSRPSLKKFMRWKDDGTIPYWNLPDQPYFVPAEVREALAEKFKRSPVPSPAPAGLYRAEKCMEIIWPNAADRPSLRTFKKWQAMGLIPFVKLMRLTYYDPAEVRRALDAQFKVKVPA